MITVVFPYWNRQAALDRTLVTYAAHYAGMELELVVVDDGSLEPVKLPRGLPWPASIMRLGPKDIPLNPCVPLNRGARFAEDVLVLTNPEVEHPGPVLQAMLRQLHDLGPFGYVLAAAWCPEQSAWHCHSTCNTAQAQGIPTPFGSGLHFCSMLYKSLFDLAGGFDEEYRAGAGYEDNDFVLRLARAGAIFKLRDDLVVHHRRADASSKWLPGQHDRNRALFFRKWAL